MLLQPFSTVAQLKLPYLQCCVNISKKYKIQRLELFFPSTYRFFLFFSLNSLENDEAEVLKEQTCDELRQDAVPVSPRCHPDEERRAEVVHELEVGLQAHEEVRPFELHAASSDPQGNVAVRE